MCTPDEGDYDGKTVASIFARDLTETEFEQLCAWEADDVRARGGGEPGSSRLGVVATESGRYVGCAVLAAYTHQGTPTGWSFLEELYLEPPYRRRGLGARLLERVERRGYELGVRTVWTRTAGYEAPSFYVRQGYATCFELPDYFRSGHGLVGLRKSLASSPDPLLPGRSELPAVELVDRMMTPAEQARMQRGFVEHGVEFGNPEASAQRLGRVAVVDGKLAGCISGLAYCDAQGHQPWFVVTNLLVAQPHRSRGIASALLHGMEAQLTQLGMRHAWMQIPSWGAGFLLDRGYRVLSEFEGWYPGGPGMATLASTLSRR